MSDKKVRSKKYFINVTDERFPDNLQFNILNILNYNEELLINQYGKVFTSSDLGEFDVSREDNSAVLSFYPIDGRINDYTYSFISFDITKDSSSNYNSILLGDLAKVGSYKTTTDNLSKIFELPITDSSAKLSIQLEIDQNNYQYDEINFTHNTDRLFLINYGTVFAGPLVSNNLGFGTYSAYIDNNKIFVDFIPNQNVISNSIVTFDISYVSIANTTFSTPGKENLRNIQLQSKKTIIQKSSNPIAVGVGSHGFEYQSSYYIAQCTDLTNNSTQLSEIVVINDRVQSYAVEFADIYNDQKIGTFSALKSLDTELFFTPEKNIDVEVVLYQQKISNIIDDGYSQDLIDLNNIIISPGLSRSGVDGDTVTSFELTHYGIPIFERVFNGSNSGIVNLNDNTILIPRHFFTTGEKIRYISDEFNIGSTDKSIIIEETNIAGIGLTNKLPEEVFVVKVNDIKIKLAKSAEDALKIIPKTFNFTSLGGNGAHKFISEKQNIKSLISIDNVIQSPIIRSYKSTNLSEPIDDISFELKVDNEKLFSTGDLISINDEFMRVFSVGVGSTNSIFVRRNILGTIRQSHSTGSLVSILEGNYNIIDNTLYFASAPYGLVPKIDANAPYDEKDYKGLETTSTFDGRVFLRSGVTLGDKDTYSENYLFDDISENFDGINSEFTITENGQDIVGISTDNSVILINSIYQSPKGSELINASGSYFLSEENSKTTINFVGEEVTDPSDINTASIPYGGVIVSVGSTDGYGYQPLVSAGGTALILQDGTIGGVSIGNSGSGYRVGIQTVVNVGVQTYSFGTSNIINIGIASIFNGNVIGVEITNPLSGYTQQNPPNLVFDAPIGYTNLPLIYSEQSQLGVGTQSTIDLFVGENGDIISFDIKNYGYGYKKNDILTIQVDGNTGIPTSENFSEFKIIVDEVFDSKFIGWSMGEFQVIDSLDSKFNGKNKNFQISLEGKPISISKKKTSPIDLEYVLLIFINDILQIPFKDYTFTGSVIRFSEPPRGKIENPPYIGDTCKIIFYKGTRDIDVQEVDILDAPKVGDNLTIKSDFKSLSQKPRIIELITTIDIADTNKYSDIGVSSDNTLLRPVTWCKQRDDLYIFNNPVTKNRKIYEPIINPITNIIKSISSSDNQIFVESANLIFNYKKENINEKKINIIEIIENNNLLEESETSLNFDNFSGWNENILPNYELIDNISSYEGDYGLIVGINSASDIGIAKTCLLFDLFIPIDSYLRDINLNSGISTSGISGIQTGYRFVISSTNIGNPNISFDLNNNIAGVGTLFIDNIYECIDFSIEEIDVPGIGVTEVTRVATSVDNYNGLTLSNFTQNKIYGKFSWGKINVPFRKSPKNFIYNPSNIVGINSYPIVRRKNSLRYDSYLP
jgi:hypothetical protein